MSRTFIIHGSYYTRNFGDLLLAELAGQKVSQLGHRPLCPWLMDDATQQVSLDSGSGLASCFLGRPLIFGGGGYLSNTGGRRRALRWLVPALATRTFGMPYIISGPGSDDAIKKNLASEYRNLIELADEVAVRDEESRDALRAIGVKRNIEVTADSAITVEEGDIPQANMQEAVDLIPKNQNAICLNAPQLSQGDLQALVSTVKQHTKTLQGVRVWLYENEAFNRHHLESILADEGMSDDIIVSYRDMWSVVAIISRCIAVITTQLHVGIVAYALGIPPSSISAHSKTKRFYRQINRSKWQRDIPKSGLDAKCLNDLESWLNAICEKDEEFFYLDSEHRRSIKDRARENFALIERYAHKLG